MSLAYLGIGTNLGNRQQNLNNALKHIDALLGDLISVSSYYVSQPWGFESDNDFLNAVVSIKTHLSPSELLNAIIAAEHHMGRTSKTISAYQDRVIDIDILFYDSLIIDRPELKIPHPLITERDFVMIPLNEIAPDFVHPVIGKKISEIINLTN